MTGHRPGRAAPAGGTQLVAAAGTAAEADEAIAAGADLIDASALTGPDVAALRARHPGLRLWHGSPAAVDADADPATGQDASPAAVVATAALFTWLGAAAIRTRHVRPARRAIDMTASIAGTRPPALTIRGLA
jgi:hypothetical protein